LKWLAARKPGDSSPCPAWFFFTRNSGNREAATGGPSIACRCTKRAPPPHATVNARSTWANISPRPALPNPDGANRTWPLSNVDRSPRPPPLPATSLFPIHARTRRNDVFAGFSCRPRPGGKVWFYFLRDLHLEVPGEFKKSFWKDMWDFEKEDCSNRGPLRRSQPVSNALAGEVFQVFFHVGPFVTAAARRNPIYPHHRVVGPPRKKDFNSMGPRRGAPFFSFQS